MKNNGLLKRPIGERVLSGALALTLGASCVATNFFGRAPKDDASVVLAAPAEPYKTNIRSSYAGDYEVGKKYYDFGELKGHAYYDSENGWNPVNKDDSTYARNGWQISDVRSYLDYDDDGHLDSDTAKIANTLPYTTDLNEVSSSYQEELMCWQAYSTDPEYRTRYLERTDIPDFASPAYDSTDAYYIAEGTVEEVNDEVVITWEIRSWPKDSDGWADKIVFEKTSLTGLDGVISDKNIKGLDDDFKEYFYNHDGAVKTLWESADFSKKSLWFGYEEASWWDGVAAAVYQADATYTGTRTVVDNEYVYNTHLVIDNAVGLFGDSVDGKIDTYISGESFGDSISGYGFAEKIFKKQVDWDDADIHTLDLQPATAVRLLDTGFPSIFIFDGDGKIIDANRDTDDADAKIGITLSDIEALSNGQLKHEDGKWYVYGSQMNEWKAANLLSDVCAITNYDDAEMYAFVSDEDIANETDLAAIDNSRAYVYLVRNMMREQGRPWLFDRSDDEIVSTLAAGYTPNDTERAAFINMVNAVEMDYDPTAGQLWVNNLTFDGPGAAPTYVISLPLVGFVGDVANRASNENVVSEKLYITTGYQRAAGAVKAKRVDSDIVSVASTEDSGVSGKNAIIKDGATIIDAVTCNGLIEGRQYRLVGALYTSTGVAVKLDGTVDTAVNDVISYDADDSVYAIVSENFTADANTYEVEMAYEYDASKLPEGTEVVVCVKLYDAESKAHEMVASHMLSDMDEAAQAMQTVTIQKRTVSSNATNPETDLKNIFFTNKVAIKDVVSYTGLDFDSEYTLAPYLVFYDENNDELGRLDCAAVSFRPEAADGSKEIDFADINVLDYPGCKSIIVGQTLKLGDTVIKDHFTNDGSQTVYVTSAKVSTVASGYEEKSSSIECDGNAIIVDKIAYDGLIEGETYTIKTSIYDKTDSKWYSDVDTDNSTFVADGTTGEVAVNITFDTSALKGHILVLGEEIYLDDKLVASHKDINDQKQTVTVETPSIKTIATVDGTAKTVDAIGNATIIDTVSYSNLTKNSSYKLVGSIYDIDADEYVVRNAESVFKAADVNGTQNVTFSGLNVIGRQGHKLVVEEILYLVNGTNEIEIARHVDRNDADQTVTVKVPSVKTNATNGNGDKIIPKSSNAVVVDEVTYENLAVGTEYTLTASLVDVAAKKVLGTYTETFTPVAADGTYTMNMTLDTTDLDGKSINVEQRLYIGTDLVLTHIDPSIAQTVSVNVPVIQTYAYNGTQAEPDDSSVKYISCGYDSKIVDAVSYAGLEAGKNYILVAEIHDRTACEADGSSVKIGSSVTKKFTANATKGDVEVDINIDATQYIGHRIVVTETLYEANGDTAGKKLAEHIDLANDDQTVEVQTPVIHTFAHGNNGEKAIDCQRHVIIEDEIWFENFPTTGNYTIITGLYDKTVKKYVDSAIKTTNFNAADIEDGKYVVTFSVDTIGLVGHELVVTQTIKHDLTNIVVHLDTEDTDQTVIVKQPELKTVASDKISGIKNLVLSSNAVIVDTVSYTNLVPGNTYVLVAAVYDKSTGSMLDVVAEDYEFVPSAPTGKVDIEITLDSTVIPSDTLVVFETLKVGDDVIAEHADKNDEDQTVVVDKPGIRTVAADLMTGTHKGVSAQKSVIKDTVFYNGLTPGAEYTLNAELYDAVTGEKISDVSASHTFKPASENGSTIVTITVDTSKYDNRSVVVFEKLSLNGKLIAVHEELTDSDQTVTYSKPYIKTVATDASYDSKTIDCVKEAIVVDKLYYNNFVVGETYNVEAFIVDTTDNNKVIINKEFTFVAETADGTVDVEFNIDTLGLKGHVLVVCETVSTVVGEESDGIGAFSVTHNDLKDADQTVYVDVPNIRTHASSKATGNHTVEKAEKAVIVDRVSYSGLTAGQTYSVTATPYNKATGKPVEGIDPVTVTFKTAASDGYVDVELEIDSTKLAGSTIVMFESLKCNGIEIAVHNDINDEDQTVYVMDIKTKATAEDKQTKVLTLNAEVKVIDTVTYKGLTVGETYVLTGQLVNKADPTKIEAEASIEFTPTKPDGDVEIVFDLDTTGKLNTNFVAFETITQKSNETVVGEHKDINDADQTVTVPDGTTPPPPPPPTGDRTSMFLFTMLTLMSFGGFVTIIAVLRKKREN